MEGMTFQYVPGDESSPGWIAADGVIEEDTPEKFKKYLEEDLCAKDGVCDLHKANVKTVGFHSPGGDLLGGIELGEMIREMRLDTALARLVSLDNPYPRFTRGGAKVWEGGICESACAYAFFGGVSRQWALFNAEVVMVYADKTGVLGVHQFYNGRGFSSDEISSKLEEQAEEQEFTTETAKTQYYTALIIDYLQEMGIHSSVLTTASNTASKDIHYFRDKGELLSTNSITLDILLWKRDNFSRFNLSGLTTPHPDKADLYAQANCTVDRDGTYYVALVVHFSPQVILGTDHRDIPLHPGASPKIKQTSDAEYNGFLIRYGDFVTVANNYSMRLSSPHQGKGQMVFDADLEQWEHIYRYGDGVLILEPIGRVSNQQPRQPQINIVTDEVFWDAFRDLGTTSAPRCANRFEPGPKVSDALELITGYTPSPARTVSPPETKPTPTLDDLELLQHVYFDEAEATLSEPARIKLNELANWLIRRPNTKILLQGRASPKEGSSIPQETAVHLGHNRSETVQNYLASQGVSEAQMTLVSFGDQRPLEDESNPNYQAENRTVRIVLRP